MPKMPIDASLTTPKQSSIEKGLGVVKQASTAQPKATKGVHMIRRHRSHTEGSRPVAALGRYREEMETEGVLPPLIRSVRVVSLCF